ncbi:outer membrane protein OmpX [Erwinia sp. OLTSP20]|uniref:outer membrane protein OmpX n=1 Tax=unclassified Erwinia TaxID=2622719 RepID=UPI000C1884B0|nr:MULTISPECIES: outer membrane protein OmpX [unclassified Erwinia]PIJ48680.1 outer membrane protein OmpX [Erwinia sp. OAMSP11]PIJ69304.1 outer membrane protein OmpX [Erwinia sp. OLSSP12]PIJ79138.1 outer membrane protein OmpX [Erwinia sp. OLCASP19]PIJ80664.1 outer membrane protein OmpX [Erwinia sp. OLMTSP26]PIJ82815.1 outer membrane protein OmpX [Erwinia sp. OLMDSP33]
MKKIACLSALACVLAVSAGSAMAKSTVSLGYAQGDMQGIVNKANGFNLKYRWEDENNPLGWIGSFTYTTKNYNDNGFNLKGQYYGFTGGPAYRINDWASIYGVIGLGYGKFNQNGTNERDVYSLSDVGFSYGAGLQFNPIENVAIDTGYEQSRIRSVDIGTWIVGVGYSF